MIPLDIYLDFVLAFLETWCRCCDPFRLSRRKLGLPAGVSLEEAKYKLGVHYILQRIASCTDVYLLDMAGLAYSKATLVVTTPKYQVVAQETK